jgi:predicted peptidase
MKISSLYGAVTLGLFVAVAAQARVAITGSEALTFTLGSSSIQYRLYRPAGWDAPGANFPVVLFLHGAGERGSNNTSQVSSHVQGLIDATESGQFAAFLIAPQVPSGQQWTDVPFGTGSYSNPTLNSPAICA